MNRPQKGIDDSDDAAQRIAWATEFLQEIELGDHENMDPEAQLEHLLKNVSGRDARQGVVFDWGRQAFGEAQMSSVPQRGLRFLEEAIELFQACDGNAAQAHLLIDYIFAKPVGAPAQELGGVGVTLLALATALGLSADHCEREEVDRVLSKPKEHWAARNQVKNDAGFKAEGITP